MDRDYFVANLGAAPQHMPENLFLQIERFVKAWPGIETHLADISGL
jgi:hypothetical protein